MNATSPVSHNETMVWNRLAAGRANRRDGKLVADCQARRWLRPSWAGGGYFTCGPKTCERNTSQPLRKRLRRASRRQPRRPSSIEPEIREDPPTPAVAATRARVAGDSDSRGVSAPAATVPPDAAAAIAEAQRIASRLVADFPQNPDALEVAARAELALGNARRGGGSVAEMPGAESPLRLCLRGVGNGGRPQGRTEPGGGPVSACPGDRPTARCKRAWTWPRPCSTWGEMDDATQVGGPPAAACGVRRSPGLVGHDRLAAGRRRQGPRALRRRRPQPASTPPAQSGSRQRLHPPGPDGTRAKPWPNSRSSGLRSVRLGKAICGATTM